MVLYCLKMKHLQLHQNSPICSQQITELYNSIYWPCSPLKDFGQTVSGFQPKMKLNEKQFRPKTKIIIFSTKTNFDGFLHIDEVLHNYRFELGAFDNVLQQGTTAVQRLRCW